MHKRLLLTLLALTAPQAGATTTYYVGNATEAAFNTAAGALTYFNFSGYAGVLPATTLVESNTGINFSSFFNNGGSATNLSLNGGTNLSQTTGSGGSNSTIVFDVPGTVRIIGMHLFASTFGLYCVDAPNATDCSSAQFSLDATPMFLGIITTDASLADFQVRHTNGGTTMLLRIGDVAVNSGAVSAAPEPSTMALVGGGLVLFPFIARRRARNRPDAAQ